MSHSYFMYMLIYVAMLTASEKPIIWNKENGTIHAQFVSIYELFFFLKFLCIFSDLYCLQKAETTLHLCSTFDKWTAPNKHDMYCTWGYFYPQLTYIIHGYKTTGTCTCTWRIFLLTNCSITYICLYSIFLVFLPLNKNNYKNMNGRLTYYMYIHVH